MTRLRSKVSATIFAITTILGCVLGIAPAYASGAAPILCPAQEYLGHIHNGSDYLDSYGGSSGEYVHTYRPTSSTNQLWCIEKAGSSGGGLFIHPYDDPSGLCLDAHTDNPGQKIWLYTCNGSDPQRWCWNGTGYIVRQTNAVMALKDNGAYNIVTIYSPANKWSTDGGSGIASNC
jgi:hypothetical protein